MKIAFIIGEFPILSETFILNQITGLLERGHEVDIYAYIPKNSSKIHPDVDKYNLLERTYYYASMPNNRFLRVLKILSLLFANGYKAPPVLLRSLNVFNYQKQFGTLELGTLTLLYAMIPLLRKRSSYDIIHCHFGWNGLKGVLLREIGAIQGKLIAAFHGRDMTTYLQEAGDRVYDRLFNTGDLFLPISERWKHRLIELGCNEKNIVVHRMGIDCRKFSFTPRGLRTNSPVRIVTIARLVEKKGVEYGIRAVMKLAKAKPNIEYHVVGDGPLREELQQLIQELDAGDTVKLQGWKHQQEIVELLDNADILLAPSVTSKDGDQEGIPVALMEAMARGLPILSTLHSGIPELIENGVSGFLVPERDVDALAEKLEYLIDHPEIWAEIGRAGRAYVEKHYDIDKLNDRLVEIYRELLI